jgi:hypothetical protein
MANGPLSARFHDWALGEVHAGALGLAEVELENTGTVAWREAIRLSYHWLDNRGNPIVWDGLRTALPLVEPGERVRVGARVRAPIPPGRYRLSLDLVAEHRAWFSQLGGDPVFSEVEVLPRAGTPRLELPAFVEPAPDFAARVAAAHAEGYTVVAAAIEWEQRLGRRRPRALAPYAPGAGRIPNFPHPLLCPSVLDGLALERLPDLAGLPAFAAPAEEPWSYDGRIVLRLHPESRPRPGI